ncbi:hypothetical protein P8C59_003362 [Phyllachora maydis]|nr:hypothetical protein P8C59_003362 [Phyllachora maydis]
MVEQGDDDDDVDDDHAGGSAGHPGTVVPRADSLLGWLLRWREGKHGHKAPKAPEAKPREFAFAVEYSTFDHATYNMTDLTVPSLVQLAYDMSRKGAKGQHAFFATDASPDDVDESVERPDEQKKQKKKKKKRRPKNQKWLHFLHHAFVSTVSDEDLEKMA